MEFPREVSHGRPVSDLTMEFNKAVRVLRAIQPVASATVKVQTLSNGTTFHVKPAAGPRGGGGGGAEVPLNQFKVTAEPDGDPPTNDYFVSMKGGTAQALFGSITFVEGVVEWANNIPSGERLFISLVYRVMSGGEYVHAFDSQADFTVDTDPPESTADTFYFPIAVVESDGTVLQGHLGAVYLAKPWNVVELAPSAQAQAKGQGE